MATLGRVEDRLVALEAAVNRLVEKVDLLLVTKTATGDETDLPVASNNPALWPVVYTDGCGIGQRGGD